MIPYIGCETAQEILEAFLDGELPMAGQVSLEAHLRWCRTCAARVEDMRVIGGALRAGSAVRVDSDSRALAAMQARVLTRVRAEHEASFAVRARSLFEDNRLLWPAVGATAALAACLFASLSVMRAATTENPASFAAMIARLEPTPGPIIPPANPGSDQNPMRLDGRLSFPRGLDGASPLDSIVEDEAAFAVAAVVDRHGRVAPYDLLHADATRAAGGQHDVTSEVNAVLDGVRRSRFTPAEAAGTKVAVNMVWLLVRSTVRGSSQPQPARPAPVKAAPIEAIERAEPTIEPEPPAPPAVTTTA